MTLGDHCGAVSDITEALKIDPKSVDALVVRGDAKNRLGDRRGAVADSTEALKSEPKKSDALSILAS